MAYITETVTIQSVSLDPPVVMPGLVSATPDDVGSLTILFSDGTRMTRAIPHSAVPSLAPLVGTQQPLALG